MVALSETTTIALPADEVWPLLSDPALVASCIPGATLSPDQGDGLWRGSVRVKFGPTVAVFRGEATLAFDHAARTCTIEGRGIDGRGASRALASGVVKVAGKETTELAIDGSFSVSGPLETFANAGGVHVARALLGEFSTNLARLVAERRPRRERCRRLPPAPADTAIAARHRAAGGQPHVARIPVVVAQPLRKKGDTEMSKLQVTDMLARAFAAEGVDMLFTLMGDANMYWSVAMSKLPGMKVVHARHEHCAVAMADGYARATGKVGVASTTCGPGFTQIMTALTIVGAQQHAARGVRGRCAARRLVVHPADRHGAARARLRRALCRREARRPRARQRARGLPGGAGRAQAGGALACRWTCRSRPGRISPTTRPPPSWCRWRSGRCPIPRWSSASST